MVKVKGVRASGAKAAQKRSELSGQLREVQTAVHRMVTERDKRIEELERKLRLAEAERAILDALAAIPTDMLTHDVPFAFCGVALAELAWRQANGRG